MPKRVPQTEFDALVATVARSRDGLGVDALSREFPGLPRRSLQRRLAHLVREHRLSAVGNGPARRYRRAAQPPHNAGVRAHGVTPGLATPASMGRPALAAVEDYVPTSRVGARLRTLVRRPLSQRTPTGFERAFLDDYVPNRTHYLPAAMRRRLLNIGRSPVASSPAGTYARQVLDRLLVDLSWASSRLEGNTYSRLDTQNLIEFGRYADGKDRVEAQMILNHKAAIEMLVGGAVDIGFNRFTVQNLHALLAENLLPDTGAGGRLRTTDVAISVTVYHPTAIPQLIEECFDNLLSKAAAIDDAFEQAFFVMVQLPYLQPFVDVNKRVSRLAANISFIKQNLAPISFVDVPEAAYIDGTLAVYELRRIELLRDVFVWAYERSCQRYTLIRQALPEPDPLRLRYRDALSSVVGGIVRNRLPVTTDHIRRLAGTAVAAGDMQDFVALAINELEHLHEGNLARHRLRPDQFHTWRNGA